MSYQIITDSGSDLPQALCRELSVQVVPLSVLFRGESRQEQSEDFIREVYAGLRDGETATTAAVNPEGWARCIEPHLQAQKDVLVLAFSSGLSTTYQSAVIAAQELSGKYPERKIRVVDTLCASLGQGLLVWYACRKQREGYSLEEVAQWCEAQRLHLCHWFTVDDLQYLKRGGRIGAGTALVGTMLGIKPVLHMDNEGHLVNMAKTRGRKAAIGALVKKMEQLGAGYDNSTVFISHGDCEADALFLKAELEKQFGISGVVIGYVGAVIGAHSGPGTLALFFLGDHR